MKKPFWHEYAGPKGFWGYGERWADADIIFLGPEFGGENLTKRVAFWKNKNKDSFADAPDFFREIAPKNNFIKNGNLRDVPTFSRLLVMLRGRDKRLRQEYAREQFGRRNGGPKISWSDLSALPCRDISAQAFKTAYNMDRCDYEEEYLPARAQAIKEFFLREKNKKVVLYGGSLFWPMIFQGNWVREELDGHSIARLNGGRNKIFRVTHPNTRGVKNSYFEHFGRQFGILFEKSQNRENIR